VARIIPQARAVKGVARRRGAMLFMLEAKGADAPYE